jgi:glc operon protein GlcG
MVTLKALVAASAVGLLAVIPAFAQQPAAPGAPAVAAPPPLPYGAPISFEVAKKAMAAAEAEAMKNNLLEVIAILDSGGNLVMLHRMENAQFGSVRIAEGKARAAIEFRRPSKAWEDAIAGGGAGVRVLSFGVTASEGGLPIVVDGKIIGAIGASGAALSSQDGLVAKAGADAVK